MQKIPYIVSTLNAIRKEFRSQMEQIHRKEIAAHSQTITEVTQNNNEFTKRCLHLQPSENNLQKNTYICRYYKEEKTNKLINIPNLMEALLSNVQRHRKTAKKL